VDPEPRFLADEMLGSLAKWLRMAGYDTAYAKDLLDGEILEKARREERYVLTRDRQLAERAKGGGLLITSVKLDEQLGQVIDAYRLRLDRPMTRCTLCNGPLREAGPREIAGRVPERVLASHSVFYVCERCGQVFWQGSHWDRIMDKLERLRAGSSPR